jgi:heme/copper-type cytochrome/quinol oxidase subunit 2
MDRASKQIVFQTVIMTACLLVLFLLIFLSTLDCKRKQNHSADNDTTDAAPVTDATLPGIPMGVD